MLQDFESNHVAEMDRYTETYMVLLIDFDENEDRIDYVKGRIPVRLMDRVFILGALGEPEGLSSAGLGSPETIGKALAKDCRDGTDITWGHTLLRSNAGEISRLRQHVRPLLFP